MVIADVKVLSLVDTAPASAQDLSSILESRHVREQLNRITTVLIRAHESKLV